MSKYKVGDKVILTVTDTNEMGCLPCYVLNDDLILSKQEIDKYTEPLSTYTEPLEAKIKRQAAEITRLLAENKKLKAESGNVIWEIEQAFDRGCNEAWELAKKCMLMTDREREAIFGSGHNALYGVLTYFDYKHAAAKVAEWEKAKEEIKVGDIVKLEKLCGIVMKADESWVIGLTEEGDKFQWSRGNCTKTGRHIDIDSFLKQIGGEE